MPNVTVHMYPGRTDEQKQRLTEAITSAVVEHARSKPEDVTVRIMDVTPEDWDRVVGPTE